MRLLVKYLERSERLKNRVCFSNNLSILVNKAHFLSLSLGSWEWVDRTHLLSFSLCSRELVDQTFFTLSLRSNELMD